MDNINILDCTLRDGGYYNNWNFSKKFINEYLHSIKYTKINYVELGFAQIKKNRNNGLCYNVDNNLINSLTIPKNLNIGIMINAKDILIKDNSPYKFRKYIFNKNLFKNSTPVVSVSYDVYKKRNKLIFEILDSIKNENIYRVYPHSYFCDKQIKDRCVANDENNIFYYDDDHLSIQGSKLVVDEIMKEIEKIELKSN